jgi:hypothetical protein
MTTLHRRALFYTDPNALDAPNFMSNSAAIPHSSFANSLNTNVSGQMAYNSVPPPYETYSPMDLGLTVPTLSMMLPGTTFGAGLQEPVVTCEKQNDAITQQELFGALKVVPPLRQQEMGAIEEIRDRFTPNGVENWMNKPGALNGAWFHPADINCDTGGYEKASFANGERLNIKSAYQYNSDRYIYAPSLGNLHQAPISGTFNRPYLPGGQNNAPLPPMYVRQRDPAFEVGPISGFPRTTTNQVPAYFAVANQRTTMRSTPYA